MIIYDERIDVSKCKFYDGNQCCSCYIDDSECCEGYRPSKDLCKQHRDCYFKQMYKYIQKNKELENYLNMLINIINTSIDYKINKNIKEINDRGKV